MELQTIKIFLASSSELKDDRRELELAILRKNDSLKNEGVFIEMIVWEDFLDTISATRLQDEYNKSILQCDIFIMLFFTKVGKFTFEEFQVALNSFKKTGKPKIYTYFKNAPIDSSNINEEDILSMLSFKKKLKDIGHYFTTYNNVDGLKYHFSEQLLKLDITPSKFRFAEKPGIPEEQMPPPSFFKNRKKSIYFILLGLLVAVVATTIIFNNSAKETITPIDGSLKEIISPIDISSNETELLIDNSSNQTIPLSDISSNETKAPSSTSSKEIIRSSNNSMKETISPIEFNAGKNSMTLTYHSNSLARSDKFQIDPNETVEYLKKALKRHYKISIPPQLLDRTSDGGYEINDVLVANHKVLNMESLSLKNAGLKLNDVIEFDYQIISSETMACRMPGVLVEIEGIEDINPILTLNGIHNPVKTIKRDGSYQFYFDTVNECNPESWIGKLGSSNNSYYLTNPYNISYGDTLTMHFNLVAQSK